MVLQNCEGIAYFWFLFQLLKYGKEHSEVTILEGILPAKEYHRLFETAAKEYGNIYAYYYDLPFEETLLRHKTKPNKNDFGEADMKRWWREKDFLPMISEKILYKDISFEETVQLIYNQTVNDIKE